MKNKIYNKKRLKAKKFEASSHDHSNFKKALNLIHFNNEKQNYQDFLNIKRKLV